MGVGNEYHEIPVKECEPDGDKNRICEIQRPHREQGQKPEGNDWLQESYRDHRDHKWLKPPIQIRSAEKRRQPSQVNEE